MIASISTDSSRLPAAGRCGWRGRRASCAARARRRPNRPRPTRCPSRGRRGSTRTAISPRLAISIRSKGRGPVTGYIRKTPNFGFRNRRVIRRRESERERLSRVAPDRGCRRPRAAPWSSRASLRARTCRGSDRGSPAPLRRLSDLPSRASWSRFTVVSTPAACSPPMTEMRALGHIQRKRGSYARPHIP